MFRDSESQIIKMKPDLPALFLSGSQDELVPPKQMRKLFELCTSHRKRLRLFPNGTHNDTCVQPNYWIEVQKWLHDEIAELPQVRQPIREGTYDERRMQGAEQELEGTIGAGSIAP